jgi:hypothetical protein
MPPQPHPPRGKRQRTGHSLVYFLIFFCASADVCYRQTECREARIQRPVQPGEARRGGPQGVAGHQVEAWFLVFAILVSHESERVGTV